MARSLFARVAALLLLSALALPAFAGTRVVVSVYPLAMIAAAVAAPDTEIRHFIPGTASTHDFQLSPGAIELINSADIVVWAGADAEPYLAALLDQPRPASQRVINLAKLPGAILREHKLDSADPKKRGRDGHLWLSTRNASLLATTLAASLGTTPRAQDFAADMQRHRNRQLKRFAAVANMPLLVAHDAYGYLFDEYGLGNVSAVVIEPGIAPSARRLADLAQRVEQEKITCMIGEPGFETSAAPRVFDAVRAAGGKANLVTLDPQLGGIGLSRNSYTLALTHFAETLYGCLVTR